MNEFLSGLSGLFLPALLGVILLHGFSEKGACSNDLFVEGCRDGIKSAVEITPYIIAVFLVIQIMTDSGALGLLEKLCGPILEPLGIPRELISFMIMRPVSGSGTLAIIENIAQTFGPDSFLCRCASVMMGEQRDFALCCSRLFRGDRGYPRCATPYPREWQDMRQESGRLSSYAK